MGGTSDLVAKRSTSSELLSDPLQISLGVFFYSISVVCSTCKVCHHEAGINSPAAGTRRRRRRVLLSKAGHDEVDEMEDFDWLLRRGQHGDVACASQKGSEKVHGNASS